MTKSFYRNYYAYKRIKNIL